MDNPEGQENSQNDLYFFTSCYFCYYYLKFMGWSQLVLYSGVAFVSLLANLLFMFTKESTGVGFRFDCTEITLIFSVWIPWVLVTIPMFIIQLANDYLITWFPILDSSATIFEGGRLIRGQIILRFLSILIFLLVGIYMGWVVLEGVSEKNSNDLKIWTIYIGILIGITIMELISMGLLRKFEKLLIGRVFLSLIVHGFSMATALILMTTDKVMGLDLNCVNDTTNFKNCSTNS